MCLQYKPFENIVGKGEIARNEQFLLFPQCFLPVWRTFCHIHQIWNCRLRTLSVWKSLKFVFWERVTCIFFPFRIREKEMKLFYRTWKSLKSLWKPFNQITACFTTPRSKVFENNMVKWENAGNQHFFLLPWCFLAIQRHLGSFNALSISHFQNDVKSIRTRILFFNW